MVFIQKVTHVNEIGVRAINEDCVLVDETRQVFGVFDGASSLVKYVSPDGKTGGYLAAAAASNAFARNPLDLKKAMLDANTQIETLHAQASIDTSNNVNRFGTMAAVVKIRDEDAELLQIGDCIVIVINTSGDAHVPLGYVDHDIIAMRKWKEFADQGVTNILERVYDDVLRQRKLANVEYGMVNGDPRLQDHIKTTTISLKDVATILILSDGMFLPKASPDADENWNEYAEYYNKSGLVGLLKTVRDIEDSDPTLTKYPRFKLHDDASAVAIDFTR